MSRPDLEFVFWDAVPHYRRPEIQASRTWLGHWVRLLCFVALKLSRHLRSFRWNVDKLAASAERAPRDRHVYYISTLNQRDALDPVVRRDDERLVVSARGDLGGDILIDQQLLHAFGYRFLFRMVRDFARSEPATRSFIADFPKLYLRAQAYHAVFGEVLTRLSPRVLIMANDHNRDHRALLDLCRRRGVRTIYMQHAAVSDTFPPLAFDWALLDGTASWDTYRAIAPTATQVSLVGIAKFAGSESLVNRSAEVRRIGLCLKVTTPVVAAIELCDQLSAWFPWADIVVRTHPRYGRKHLRSLTKACGERGLEISLGTAEASTAFLAGVDLIVAGNSSILLEAALLNVVPIYYNGMERDVSHRHPRAGSFCEYCHFATYRPDYYGFVRHGICRHATNLEALREYIAAARAARPDSRGATRPFCETVNTELDFRSDVLALDSIRKIARGQPLPLRHVQ